MKLHAHYVDPHYSHDFADLHFEGKRVCLTGSKSKPITPLEMVATYGNMRDARAALREVQGRPIPDSR